MLSSATSQEVPELPAGRGSTRSLRVIRDPLNDYVPFSELEQQVIDSDGRFLVDRRRRMKEVTDVERRELAQAMARVLLRETWRALATSAPVEGGTQ